MPSKIRKYIPNKIYENLRKVFLIKKLFTEYLRDFRRYLGHSSILSVDTDSQFLGRVSATYHVVEKGLSMPAKRMGFGGNNIIRLCGLIKQASESGLIDTLEVRSAVASLKQYYEDHQKHNYKLKEPVVTALDSIKEFFDDKYSEYGGSKSITSKELLKHWQIDFQSFIKTRHSIRNYSIREVNIALIEEAVDLASYSPSVCNRQSSRVIVIRNKEKIKQALQFQNGNRGFGHLCQVLLVVTSDLSSFHEYQERNQCFIDSGLFSMSLLYSLQSLGLGACPLNWCTTSTTDIHFKKAFKIPSKNVVSMMISVGHLPEQIEVAISKRKQAHSLIIEL